METTLQWVMDFELTIEEQMEVEEIMSRAFDEWMQINKPDASLDYRVYNQNGTDF